MSTSDAGGENSGYHDAGATGSVGLEAGNVEYTQTLYILIFRGHPRDIQSARVVELYIVFNNNDATNLTLQLRGHRVSELWNQPLPRTRPHFHRAVEVATFPAQSEFDLTLRDAISNTSLRTDDSDFNYHTWVGEVLGALHDTGLITESDCDSAITGMVNVITQAPWQ